MFIIDLTNPLTLVLLLIATVLLIFLGKEIKKPHAPAAALIFLFLAQMRYLTVIAAVVVGYLVYKQPYTSLRRWKK